MIVRNLAECRRDGGLATGERRRKLGEQPRSAQAAPAYDDSVTPGRGHHGQGVIGVEDVAIAQHRNAGDMLFEQGDLFPVGAARVALRGGAGMQRDRGRALFGGNASGVQMGVMRVVDADPELHGDGDAGAFGGAHRCGHDLAE